MHEFKSYPVWDAGTRWFHWINALCVIGLAAVGFIILKADSLEITDGGKVLLKTIHVWIGYVLVANLLWRFVWAFIGNRYARWRAILPGGRGYLGALRAYVAAFAAGRPQQYLGHNPAGRLGVAAILLLISVQALTGLVLAGTDLFYPPIGRWIAEWVAAPGVPPESLVPYAPGMYDPAAWESMRAFRKPFITIHEYGFYVLGFVVIAHVAAVIVTEVRERGSIISAMFTGRKFLGQRPADADDDHGE